MPRKSATAFLIGAVIAAILYIPSTTSAQDNISNTQWTITDEARARLISGVKTIGDDTTIMAALELELAEGWHTYWKNPGDSGLPPRFRWDASTNIESIDVAWPVPTRKKEQELFTVFSYGEKTTFPLTINLRDGNTDTALALTMQYMVCKDICIPAQIDTTLNLEAGEGLQSAQYKRIERALEKIPATENGKSLSIDALVASKDALVISVKSDRALDDVRVFPYIKDDIALTSDPQITLSDKDTRAMITIPAPENIENLSAYLAGKDLSVTVANGKNALEKITAF